MELLRDWIEANFRQMQAGLEQYFVASSVQDKSKLQIRKFWSEYNHPNIEVRQNQFKAFLFDKA